MSCQIGVSLDGFAAGPDQRRDEPLGTGGERLHEWMFGRGTKVDEQIAATITEGVGAFIMGRKMFGGAGDDGRWDLDWKGWWGEDPPYHAPVYVLTHHEREPLPMQGGTTFHFVTGGIEDALEQARAAAGDRRVDIAGGASTVQQYLRAGLIDDLYLHIAPVILGAGERLLDDVGDLELEPVEVVASPAVTHVRYRVGAAGLALRGVLDLLELVVGGQRQELDEGVVTAQRDRLEQGARLVRPALALEPLVVADLLADGLQLLAGQLAHQLRRDGAAVVQGGPVADPLPDLTA